MRCLQYITILFLTLLLLSGMPTDPVGQRSVRLVASIHFSSNPFFHKTDHFFDNSYAEWNLEVSGLSKDAFEQAMIGYQVLLQRGALQKPRYLTIVDFSKSSSCKRLYILDMKNGKILFNTLVAHGRNSGNDYATAFSNEEESYKSSLGFYITLQTYFGENGYSLKLKGCEKGINDNAYNRAIVFHGASYVSENFIRQNGYLGRSYGCPAVPAPVSKKIIDVIKEGSCMFLYYPSKGYLAQSSMLHS